MVKSYMRMSNNTITIIQDMLSNENIFTAQVKDSIIYLIKKKAIYFFYFYKTKRNHDDDDDDEEQNTIHSQIVFC